MTKLLCEGLTGKATLNRWLSLLVTSVGGRGDYISSRACQTVGQARGTRPVAWANIGSTQTLIIAAQAQPDSLPFWLRTVPLRLNATISKGTWKTIIMYRLISIAMWRLATPLWRSSSMVPMGKHRPIFTTAKLRMSLLEEPASAEQSLVLIDLLLLVGADAIGLTSKPSWMLAQRIIAAGRLGRVMLSSIFSFTASSW